MCMPHACLLVLDRTADAQGVTSPLDVFEEASDRLKTESYSDNSVKAASVTIGKRVDLSFISLT